MRDRLLLTVVFCAACASVKGSTKEEKREFIDKFADDSIVRLDEEDVDAKAERQKAVGYGVFKKTVTKVPLVGAGGGYGVIVERTSKKRTYMKVRELQLGGGYGVKGTTTIIVFHDQKFMARILKGGEWRFGASAGASAGDKGAAGGTGGGDEFSAYVLTDSGASATATVNALHIMLYGSLNKK